MPFLNNIQNCLNGWYDYYPNIEKPTKIGETLFSGLTYDSKTSSLSLKGGDSYVLNCYFYDLTADYGAAILSTTTNNILVEKCTISFCNAINDTAGIRVTKGNCVISFICCHHNKN